MGLKPLLCVCRNAAHAVMVGVALILVVGLESVWPATAVDGCELLGIAAPLQSVLTRITLMVF